MKSVLHLILLWFVSLGIAIAGEIVSADYTDDSQRTIRFTIGEKKHDVTAPDGRYWEDLIVCGDRTVAYFVMRRRSKNGGSWIEDLHRFDANPQQDGKNPSPIPLKTDLEDAKVMRIFDSSGDGSRLLIELHYSYKKEGDSTFYRTYPYFLSTRNGKLTPVKP
jgi:hypothetical protein